MLRALTTRGRQYTVQHPTSPAKFALGEPPRRCHLLTEFWGQLCASIAPTHHIHMYMYTLTHTYTQTHTTRYIPHTDSCTCIYHTHAPTNTLHMPHTCRYVHTTHTTHMLTCTFTQMHTHICTPQMRMHIHTQDMHTFPQGRIAILGRVCEPETHKTVIAGNDYADWMLYLPNYSALELFLFKATRRVLLSNLLRAAAGYL